MLSECTIIDDSYSNGFICSSELSLNGSYTLNNGNSGVYSWTQSSQTMGSAGAGMGGIICWYFIL